MTAPTPRHPAPAILLAYDCWRLLATQEIARVAWAGPDGVAVVPVNYTVADGALWFRTQPHSALGRQCLGGRVAVEVDHVAPADRSAWSVVVIGTAQAVGTHDAPDEVMEMRVWPPGQRHLLIRVEPVEISGRRLWHRA